MKGLFHSGLHRCGSWNLKDIVSRSKRKILLPCLILFQIFLSFSTVSYAQLASTPWPMFMHDFQHTGQSVFSGPKLGSLYQKYQIGLGIEASPVLDSDGTVYIGDIQGRFYAVNPSTGEKTLLKETDGGIYAAAAVDTSGNIYFGSEDSYLYAVKKDGTFLWRFGTLGGIGSSPVINLQDNTIYFGSEDKNIYAVDSSGNQKWKAELDEEIWSSPALDVASNTLYVGTINGAIYAVDSANGNIKWSYDTQDFIIGSPSIDGENGLVVFGTGEGKVFALDEDDGTIKWVYPQSDNETIGAILSTPAINVDKDVVYVGDKDGTLYALNNITGTLKWEYSVGSGILSSPAMDKDGVIYFGCEDSHVYSIKDADTNATLKWSYPTGGEVNSSPAINSNSLLFVGSYDGYLYAIGSDVASGPLNAEFTATPKTVTINMPVQFIDQSAGAIDSWNWDFGDGNTDTSQNPSHVYTSLGNFTVMLTVTGESGSNTEIKNDYITVVPQSSEITTLAVSASTITFGESLTLTGTITTGDASQITLSGTAQVTFNFTNASSGTDTATVASDTNGSFALTDYFPPKGGLWSVTASWTGDSEYSGAESDSQTFTVNQAIVSGITLVPSSTTTQTDQPISVTGVVTLVPNNETTRNEFLADPLILTPFNHDWGYLPTVETTASITGDQLTYTFENVSLPFAGKWELSVGYNSNESFIGTTVKTDDEEEKIGVKGIPKPVAGYAIVVEGFIAGFSGLESHNLTTNYVYNMFVERGFKADDIYYLNYDKSQSGVDEQSSEEEVLYAIKKWASEKMNNVPAPLYIVFVGHSEADKFFIHPEKLTADALADALKELESKLISEARAEPIGVILGFNQSGSFIDNLSKSGSNRIIITSSDTGEIAYKGPLSPEETIRHGDYFVYELFNYIGRDKDLLNSYKFAAREISAFTFSGTTTVNAHFDNTSQHPMLDDNGDGVGAYYNGMLFTLSGNDEALSIGHFVGNATITTKLEFTGVPNAVFMSAEEINPTLYATVNDYTLIDINNVWVELVSPQYSLEGGSSYTEQQVIDLPRFKYDTVSITENKIIWNDFSDNGNNNTFTSAGQYRAFYFAKDITGEIIPFLKSDVFKNAPDNQPPTDFGFVYPTEGAETSVVLVFDWEDVETGEDETVKYNFMISETPFVISGNTVTNPIYYQQQDLIESFAVVDSSAGLADGTTYYWSVMAIDSNGGVTFIGISSKASTSKLKAVRVNPRKDVEDEDTISNSFTPKLSNGYLGYVKGFVFDKATDANIADATVSVEETKDSYTTTETGGYFIQLPSGTYDISANATGYDEKTITVEVKSFETTVENIGLTAGGLKGNLTGTVVDKKTLVPLEGMIVEVKLKPTELTTTTDAAGSFTFTDLESGKYKLKVTKDGYKKYKETVKVKGGETKTLEIKMKQKK